MKSNMHGDSKLGCLIYLLILGLIVYVGFCWGKSQWNFESMKEVANETVKFAVEQREINYEMIKQTLLEKAKEIDITVYEEDIEISENESSLTIDVYWDTPIAFPGYTYYLEHHLRKTRQKRY